MNISSPWISVGELEQGFAPDNNSLQPVPDLSGKTLSLHFNNGRTIEHHFVDDTTLIWTVLRGEGAGESSQERYTATNPRPEIYLVDFVKSRERAMSVSLVLDTGQGTFTAVIAELPTREEAEKPFLERIAAGQELTGVRATFLHGSINTPFTASTPRHETTTELIGKRVVYIYSPTEQYEHVYTNQNYYTWHCLRGSEQGLSDSDRCSYYKLSDLLYLFVWREKINPTLGLVIVDLRTLQTTGKVLGYHGNDFGRLSNFPVGAKARIVSSVSDDDRNGRAV